MHIILHAKTPTHTRIYNLQHSTPCSGSDKYTHIHTLHPLLKLHYNCHLVLLGWFVVVFATVSTMTAITHITQCVSYIFTDILGILSW